MRRQEMPWNALRAIVTNPSLDMTPEKHARDGAYCASDRNENKLARRP
jgi:hypothetical protein